MAGEMFDVFESFANDGGVETAPAPAAEQGSETANNGSEAPVNTDVAEPQAPAEQKPAEQKPATQQAEAPKPVAEQKPAPDVNELVKGMPVSELLKLKGVDEKLVSLYNLWEQKGDVTDYFKAYNTDYDKLGDLEIKKLQLRDKYQVLTPEEQDEMIEAELENYKLNEEEFGEKTARLEKLRLKADVAEYRTSLKKRQQEMLIPAADAKGQTGAQSQQSEALAMQEFANAVRNSVEFKELTQKGVLKVGTGEDAFNIGISPQDVFDVLTSPDKAIGALTQPDGKTNYTKMLLAAAIQHDMEGVVSKLIDHGRNLEKIAFAKGVGNEGVDTTSQSARVDADEDALMQLSRKLR